MTLPSQEETAEDTGTQEEDRVRAPGAASCKPLGEAWKAFFPWSWASVDPGVKFSDQRQGFLCMQEVLVAARDEWERERRGRSAVKSQQMPFQIELFLWEKAKLVTSRTFFKKWAWIRVEFIFLAVSNNVSMTTFAKSLLCWAILNLREKPRMPGNLFICYLLQYENQNPFYVKLIKHYAILLGQIPQQRTLSPRGNEIPGVERIGVL